MLRSLCEISTLQHLMKQGVLKLVTVFAASFFEKLIPTVSVHSLQDFQDLLDGSTVCGETCWG